MPDFLPRRDADLLCWSAAFKKNIVMDPAAYGLSQAQADSYALNHDRFEAGYSLAVAPASRTRSSIIAKDELRDALKADARKLATIVRATPGITAEQRAVLGLGVRQGASPSRIGRPSAAPRLSLAALGSNTVRLRVRHPDWSRRGKANGIAGAAIYGCAGEEPPASVQQWSLMTNATRMNVDVTFECLPYGALVWLCACFFNPRHENGPMSTPVCLRLAGGTYLRLNRLAA